MATRSPSSPASTGALVKVIASSSYGFNSPLAIASDGTHVWAANASGNSVTELSASTGALVDVIDSSSYGFNSPSAIASDGTHVWVANASGNSVTELSASTGALVDVIAQLELRVQQPRGHSLGWHPRLGGEREQATRSPSSRPRHAPWSM